MHSPFKCVYMICSVLEVAMMSGLMLYGFCIGGMHTVFSGYTWYISYSICPRTIIHMQGQVL